jgi:hypothetical protein
MKKESHERLSGLQTRTGLRGFIYSRRGFPLVTAGMLVVVMTVAMHVFVHVFAGLVAVLMTIMGMSHGTMLMLMLMFVFIMAAHSVFTSFMITY